MGGCRSKGVTGVKQLSLPPPHRNNQCALHHARPTHSCRICPAGCSTACGRGTRPTQSYSGRRRRWRCPAQVEAHGRDNGQVRLHLQLPSLLECLQKPLAGGLTVGFVVVGGGGRLMRVGGGGRLMRVGGGRDGGLGDGGGGLGTSAGGGGLGTMGAGAAWHTTFWGQSHHPFFSLNCRPPVGRKQQCPRPGSEHSGASGGMCGRGMGRNSSRRASAGKQTWCAGGAARPPAQPQLTWALLPGRPAIALEEGLREWHGGRGRRASWL